MAGMSLAKKLDLHDEVMSLLDDIGASTSQKVAAEEEWRKGIAIIYHRRIGKALAEDGTLKREFQGLLDMKEWRVPSPREIEEFLRERGGLTEETQNWINDYQHYLDTNELRNRDAFAQR